ncbi:MAG: orotate phosphoribosyltransferase [Thaumarchaeota archaeon]|nr:orotate phosphoribosyltransferase [Nitrososphaerota archaeon]
MHSVMLLTKTWAVERKDIVRNLGKVLVKSGALKFGAFTLASGKLSSYYIDLRIVPSLPSVFSQIVRAYTSLIKRNVRENRFDIVAGIPTAGLTYATAVAYELSKPLIYIRKEKKEYGAGKEVEGLLPPGAKVVIIDDVITTGGSLIAAINSVRRSGGTAEKAVVLIDRLEEGRKNLADVEVDLVSLTSIAEITDFLYDMNIIEDAQRNAIYAQAGISKS